MGGGSAKRPVTTREHSKQVGEAVEGTIEELAGKIGPYRPAENIGFHFEMKCVERF